MTHYALKLILLIRLESEANMHDGWRKKAQRTATNRMFAKIEVLSKLNEKDRRGIRNAPEICVHLTRIAPRPLDDDNLSRAFKAVRDGIADAMGIGDKAEEYRWVYHQRSDKALGYAIEIKMYWEAR